MNNTPRDRIGLFMTGYIQVVLVALNTYQLAHNKYIGALIVGFLISLVWTLNVKRVAFGDWTDRIIYSTGAAAGCVSGLFIANIIY